MLAKELMTLVVPLTIIALAIPLILKIVPRNPIYGFRTRLTMSSDDAWYYANRISGIALLAAGIFWFALGRLLPGAVEGEKAALRQMSLLGAGAVLVVCGVSFWLTYRRFGN